MVLLMLCGLAVFNVCDVLLTLRGISLGRLREGNVLMSPVAARQHDTGHRRQDVVGRHRFADSLASARSPAGVLEHRGTHVLVRGPRPLQRDPAVHLSLSSCAGAVTAFWPDDRCAGEIIAPEARHMFHCAPSRGGEYVDGEVSGDTKTYPGQTRPRALESPPAPRRATGGSRLSARTTHLRRGGVTGDRGQADTY